MQVDVGVRHLAHEVEARHDHPRHPEEQDLGSGHQRVAGVERREVRRALRPAQARERHQPRGEPGVEHVLVLPHGAAAAGTRADVGPAHRGAAAAFVLAIPHRNAVAPPELAGDAPVADALEPLGVVVAAALGDEPQRTVAVLLERGARERRHPDEPLVGEPRLHHGAAAIAVADGVTVGLHLLQQPGRLELRHDPRAGLVPVESLEPVGRREADARLGGHHVDRRAGRAAGRSRSRRGRAPASPSRRPSRRPGPPRRPRRSGSGGRPPAA